MAHVTIKTLLEPYLFLLSGQYVKVVVLVPPPRCRKTLFLRTFTFFLRDACLAAINGNKKEVPISVFNYLVPFRLHAIIKEF